MRPYETLEELIKAPEDEHLQFKEAKMRFDFSETVKICCALSNSGGGRLVLGVTDKHPRQVVGSNAFPQPERERENLMDKLHIRVDFQIYEYKNMRVLVFEVAGRPLGMPIQAYGIVWCYVGDSLIPMSQNMQQRIYAESGHDFSNDICKGAKLADLDASAIEIFREKWSDKSGNSRIKKMSDEQLLRDCNAINDEGITYAALVLFGTSVALVKHLALSEIVFEYRSTEAAGPADARENFRMAFFQCYDRIWDIINLRNTKQPYQDGFFIFDILTFNERVVREVLLNAVSHRNYQIEGSIFVKQYKDRLVVESPGGFPSGITIDNIIDRQKPRNRRIAEILSLSGLVERAGQGMNLIYEYSIKEAKALPDFTGTDEYLVHITLNGLVLDHEMLKFIKKIGNERQELLYTDDFLTINALLHGLKLTEKMRARLKHLAEIGIIEHVGHGKYILARGLYESVGKAGVHTREVGLDNETKKALIIKHITSSGDKGAPLKELQQVLPALTYNQLQFLVKKLNKEGVICLKGSTKGARWVLAKTSV